MSDETPPKAGETRPYLVLRDTREQTGWDFPAKAPCLGTREATLKTGDYTLEGYEGVLAVERKRSTGEIAANLVEGRFWRELERLDAFAHPYLVCEFTLADVLAFPHESGIPRPRWRSLRVSAQFLLKRLMELQVRHRTRVIFAGVNAREFLSSLFKRITENVAPADKV